MWRSQWTDLVKTYCIRCGRERDGIEIEDDIVLDSIRWFKRNVTKNETGNRLVICKDCYPEYKKSRKRFESRQRLYLALGVIFVLLAVFVSSFNAVSFAVSLLVLLFLYSLSFLSYTPRIGIKKPSSNS